MNPHNPCAVDALLAGHALGDLDAAEREQLAALLLQHPELRQRLEEFQTTLELLPLALPAIAPPPQRLRRRLLERLDQTRGEGLPPEQGRQRRDGFGPLGPLGHWLVPALMGIALLALGAQLQQTRQQLARIEQRVTARAESRLATAPESRRMVLEPVDPLLRVSGEVMVTGNPTHNVLMLNDLPPPPPHHVYRLWANVDGQKVGCVAFVPTAQGHVAMLIPTMPTSVATSVSVSVETDQVGASPTGRVVLSSNI
ncbi:MAG TPA: anti-sigma factor [Cyanobium sp.]|nr:anti-sigma factor [Cyanobium sp.]